MAGLGPNTRISVSLKKSSYKAEVCSPATSGVKNIFWPKSFFTWIWHSLHSRRCKWRAGQRTPARPPGHTRHHTPGRARPGYWTVGAGDHHIKKVEVTVRQWDSATKGSLEKLVGINANNLEYKPGTGMEFESRGFQNLIKVAVSWGGNLEKPKTSENWV